MFPKIPCGNIQTKILYKKAVYVKSNMQLTRHLFAEKRILSIEDFYKTLHFVFSIYIYSNIIIIIIIELY